MSTINDHFNRDEYSSYNNYSSSMNNYNTMNPTSQSVLKPFSDIKSNEVERRHNVIKQKLDSLSYNLPLGYDSLPLVERLINDISEYHRSSLDIQEKNRKLIEEKENEIAIGNPLRNQNITLVNENKLLHQEIERIRNENNNKNKINELNARSLQDKILEFQHLLQEKDIKIKEMEIDNSRLNKKLSDVLEKVYGKPTGLDNIDKVIKNDIPFFVKKQEFLMTIEIPQIKGSYHDQSHPMNKTLENHLLSKEEWARDLKQSEIRCEKYREANKELDNKLKNLKSQYHSLEEVLAKKENELRKFYDNYAPLDEIKYKYELENLKKQIEKVNLQNDVLNRENHKLKNENHIHKHRCFFEEVNKQDKEIAKLRKENETLKKGNDDDKKKPLSHSEKSPQKDIKIKNIEQTLQNVQYEKESLIEKNQELSNLLHEVKQQMKTTYDEILSTHNSEKLMLNKNIKDLEKSNQEYKKRDQENKIKEHKLISEVELLKTENNLLKGKDLMLLKDMNEKTFNVDHIYKELQNTLQENQNFRDLMEQKDKEYKEKDNKIISLTKNNQELTNTMESLNRKIREKEEENHELRNKIAKEDMMINKYQTSTTMLENKSKTLENEKDNFDKILTQKNNIIKDQESSISNLKSTITEKDEIIAGQGQEYKNLSEELKAQLEYIRKLEEDLRVLKNENSSGIGQNSLVKMELLEEQISKLKNEKAVFLVEQEALHKKIKSLNEKTASLEQEITKKDNTLETYYNEQNMKIQNLNDEILNYKTKLTSLDRSSTDVNDTMVSLKKENSDLTQKNNVLKSENENLKGEKTVLEFEIKKLSLEKNNLNDNIKVVKLNIDDKTKEISSLHETIRKLREKMVNEDSNNNTKTNEEIISLQEKNHLLKTENEKLAFIAKNNSDKTSQQAHEIILLQQHNDKLLKMIEETNKSKEDLLNKLNEEISKRRNLEEEKEYKHDNEGLLANQLQKLKEDNENLRFSLNTLSSKFDRMSDELDTKTEEIKRLSNELTNTRKINDDINKNFTAQVERHKTDFTKLNERESFIRDLQEKIGTLESHNKELLSQQKKSSLDFETLQNDFKTLLGQNQKLTEEIHNHSQETEKLRLASHQYGINNDYYNKKVHSLEHDNNILTEQYRKALKEATKLKQNLNIFQEENKAAAEFIETQNKNLEEAHRFMEQIKQDNIVYQDKIADHEKYINSVNEENNKLKEIIKKNDLISSDMNININASKEINSNYENHILELSKKIARLEKEKNEAVYNTNQAKINSEMFNTTKQKLEKDKKQLEKILQEERSQQYSLAKHNESLQKEIQTLKQQILVFKESNNEYSFGTKNKNNKNDETMSEYLREQTPQEESNEYSLPRQIKNKSKEEAEIKELKSVINHLKKTNKELQDDNLRMSKRYDTSSKNSRFTDKEYKPKNYETDSSEKTVKTENK